MEFSYKDFFFSVSPGRNLSDVDKEFMNPQPDKNLSKTYVVCCCFVLWQYWLWSFQGRDTKLDRFLAKDQL